MSETRRRLIANETFRLNHGFTRRNLLAATAAAGGLAIVGDGALSIRGTAAQDVTGGPIEVGVLYEEGPWFDHVKAIGDSLEADIAGTDITYTFANTASDSARALRWENGDPLDVDTGRWSSQAPPTYNWVDNGFVSDLTSYLTSITLDSGEVWASTFTAGSASFAADNRPGSATPGSWFGVPYEMVLMLVHYNVAIFEEFGITPPTTWAEFLTVCETINEKGAERGIKPICVSGPTDVYCGHWWDRMTQRVVGREGVEAVIYGDAKVADNPGFLTAAQELAKLPENGWFMDGFDGADFTTAQAMFFQGKAAMIHMGSWLAAEMKDSIPADFKLGVFDFPAFEGGAGDQAAMFGTAQLWSVASPEKSTSHEVNVPLAVEYLKRWTSRERQAERASSLGMIPTVTNVDPPAGTVGMADMVVKSATSQTIIYYYGIHWDTALWAAWYPAIQALFLGKMGPDEMIAWIDENMAKYREVKAAGG